MSLLVSKFERLSVIYFPLPYGLGKTATIGLQAAT
jgi:hypothetical protein